MDFKLSLLLFVSLSANAMDTNPFKVSIELNQQDPDELARILAKPDSVIVNWYIGESGITEKGAQFYNDEVFTPAVKKSSDVKFHLYDLAGWQALRNKNCKLTSESKVGKAVNALNNTNFTVVPSSDFFTDLEKIEDQEILKIYKDILKNKALHVPSLSRKKNNILVKDILPYQSLEGIYDMDTAHAYSALQYLEGLYLVKNALRNNEVKNVSLMLPNDEFKYYVQANLNNDLFQSLAGSLAESEEDYIVNIRSFNFGNATTDRPYILKDKKVAPTKIKNFFPCRK